MTSPKRKCTSCKRILAVSSFTLDPTSGIDGRDRYCRRCRAAYRDSVKEQDPEGELNGLACPMDDVPIRGRANRKFCSTACRTKAASLRSRYGLLPRQFRDLVAATAGRCPVCERNVYSWNVDHEHKSGLVYGVVCSQCNTGGIAWTFHSVDYVRRLLSYLERSPASQLGIVAVAPEGSPANRPSTLHTMWRKKRTA